MTPELTDLINLSAYPTPAKYSRFDAKVRSFDEEQAKALLGEAVSTLTAITSALSVITQKDLMYTIDQLLLMTGVDNS